MEKIKESTHLNAESKLLDPEFEHTAVPLEYRKKLSSVSAVWFGFPMVLTSAVIGGLITAQLGFKSGALAMLLGNLLLFVVVGLLSYDAGRTGLNFSLTAKKTFGRSGYYLVSGLLSTVVIGWFALQIGLTGATMHDSFGSNLLVMTLAGGFLYVIITYIGIKALSFLGWIAAPFYFLIAAIAVYMALKEGNSDILSYQPHVSSAMSFGAAVTLVFAGFADSGTMTADFTRWAKNGREGFLSTIFAFPIGNFIAEMVGGIVVATGVIPNPASTGGDFMTVLSGHGTLLTVLSVIFVFINLGSVATHCLYNGAVGWSHMSGKKMRTITLFLGFLGVLAAVSGIYNHFFNWLVLLGVIIPPISAIMIADRLVLNRGNSAQTAAWNPVAITSWGLAAIVSLFINFQAPNLPVAVIGLVAGAVFYIAGSKLFNK
ncbi:cytosine permease [[Enterobacter] lignolyticus]|uniref:Permease for cytosine/purines uracil thiamine allantoin n=1 Tax=Enterobacter lignolyticus (strain SCF1) TaxID=701347 RepID=E3G8G8_ENTLS|nr:cytosine permease [[Enterobacter] lignolyticus]ADO46357.1 permease for cytosine/purines uracil thiamine allantoin [[Enterobacter] lignolyticus SCF1]